jgi:hypothetical protein
LVAVITPLIRRLALAMLISLLAAGCGGAAGPHTTGTATPRPTGTDPPTVAALLRIAQVFNDDYDNGHFGAVYDRWDASSQAIISRAEYIRRHTLCAPATHAVARVSGAVPGHGGDWLVSYRIDNSPLVDTWFYVRHRWVFDIALSNPGAARNYRLPFARYAAAVGCTTH